MCSLFTKFKIGLVLNITALSRDHALIKSNPINHRVFTNLNVYMLYIKPQKITKIPYL